MSVLQERFSMTRFGVMKHLKQRTWHTGTTSTTFCRSDGPKRPVPIRLVRERWVSKYAKPWAAALGGLKNRLESLMEKVFEIYIRTTPERLWEAITDGEIRSKYNFGTQVSSEWTLGSRYEMSHPAATELWGKGRTSRSTPLPAGPEHGCALERLGESEGISRVICEIEPVGDSCRLTVTHDQLREGANDELYGGWPMILSGLKTWLETGDVLTTPGSLLHS